MEYRQVEEFVRACSRQASKVISWCDEDSFSSENVGGVSPGGYLNPFGYYVIGTTVGGNAIVTGDQDHAVYFADHSWYTEEFIGYQDLAGDDSWHDLPYSAMNVKKSLLELAKTRDQFVERLFKGQVDRTVERID